MPDAKLNAGDAKAADGKATAATPTATAAPAVAGEAGKPEADKGKEKEKENEKDGKPVGPATVSATANAADRNSKEQKAKRKEERRTRRLARQKVREQREEKRVMDELKRLEAEFNGEVPARRGGRGGRARGRGRGANRNIGLRVANDDDGDDFQAALDRAARRREKKQKKPKKKAGAAGVGADAKEADDDTKPLSAENNNARWAARNRPPAAADRDRIGGRLGGNNNNGINAPFRFGGGQRVANAQFDDVTLFGDVFVFEVVIERLENNSQIQIGFIRHTSFYPNGYIAGEYAYISTGQKAINSSFQPYGRPYRAGDVITAVLEFVPGKQAGQVSFYHNYIPQGMLFTRVPFPVCFGVAMNGQSTQVRMRQPSRIALQHVLGSRPTAKQMLEVRNKAKWQNEQLVWQQPPTVAKLNWDTLNSRVMEVKNGTGVQMYNFLSARIDRAMNVGRHFVEIELERGRDLYFGLARGEMMFYENRRVGEDNYSQYAWRVNQNNFANDPTGQYVNPILRNGDRIGIEVDCDRRTVAFWHNDEELGTIYTNILLPCYIAVSVRPNTRVRLVTYDKDGKPEPKPK